MEVTIVPSSSAAQLFTSYLVDGRLAVDAGCLGNVGDIQAMARVKHVFLSHSHVDHVASLGPFVDAVYDGTGDCVQVYGHPHTLDSVRRDLFNNRAYPDFLHLSTTRPPFLRLNELTAGLAVEVDGLRVTPVPVDHVVPTFGFVVDDGESAAAFSSDTGPTEALWAEAARRPNLRAVFLECTFPNALAWLAEVARHLTPELYAGEVAKLGRACRFITVHLHPRHRAAVEAELLGLRLPGVEVGVPGRTYALGAGPLSRGS